MHPSDHTKLVQIDALPELREGLRARGLTLAHCHGCFDIVHPGHIHHLKFAARQGDRLIVSVTPDRFVNKGPERPMFNERLRAENLAALGFVDYVVINDAPTAESLLGLIQPDRYIKGAEYASNRDPRFIRERDIVEHHGGGVVFSLDDLVYSSSALVESIRNEAQRSEPEASLHSLAREHDLSPDAIGRDLNTARGKRVLVLSECIVDLYAHCQHPEVAQEHPILSLCPDREEQFDGGGAIIARHLTALGLDVTLCTPLGRDTESLALSERLGHQGIRVEPIACETPPPVKLRYLVNNEKIMKIDSGTRYALDASCSDQIIRHVHTEGGYDAMVIADFGLGLFANQLASRVITAVRGHIGMILGDVSGRRARLSEMRGADVLCPCEVELRQMLDADDEPIAQLAARAMEITRVGTLCVTRAAQGLMIFDRDSGVHAVPALCPDPVDVLGCGDALLTAMCVSFLGGADRVRAGFAGSIAAAIEGESRGNHPVGVAQILERARFLCGQDDISRPSLPGSEVEPLIGAMTKTA